MFSKLCKCAFFSSPYKIVAVGSLYLYLLGSLVRSWCQKVGGMVISRKVTQKIECWLRGQILRERNQRSLILTKAYISQVLNPPKHVTGHFHGCHLIFLPRLWDVIGITHWTVLEQWQLKGKIFSTQNDTLKLFTSRTMNKIQTSRGKFGYLGYYDQFVNCKLRLGLNSLLEVSVYP